MSGSSDGCQVRSGETLEVASVESDGSTDLAQRWDRDAGSVFEGGIACDFEVRQAHFEGLSIGINGQFVRNVANLTVEFHETVVIVDIERANAGDVDTIEVLEEGVLDEDGRCLGDGGWEREEGQCLKGTELDVLGRGQLREGQS